MKIEKLDYNSRRKIEDTKKGDVFVYSNEHGSPNKSNIHIILDKSFITCFATTNDIKMRYCNKNIQNRNEIMYRWEYNE